MLRQPGFLIYHRWVGEPSVIAQQNKKFARVSHYAERSWNLAVDGWGWRMRCFISTHELTTNRFSFFFFFFFLTNTILTLNEYLQPEESGPFGRHDQEPWWPLWLSSVILPADGRKVNHCVQIESSLPSGTRKQIKFSQTVRNCEKQTAPGGGKAEQSKKPFLKTWSRVRRMDLQRRMAECPHIQQLFYFSMRLHHKWKDLSKF